MKGYKFIQSNMKSKSGNHTWEIGKWYKENEIKLCSKGFHACKEPLEAFEFIYGDRFFLIEVRGKIIHDKDKKFVATEMRLLKEINLINVSKRFAIWCAKSCLKIYEKEYPNDKRPFEAIKAAEDYLDNKISLEELNKKKSAAWSAAWSAESAAWSAARSAAWSAESAATSAARSAATSAAWSAEYAARSAKYAAWSAEYAAKSAAWSAEYAARSAKYAAWSAEYAARSAALSVQNKELKRLIKEDLKCNLKANTVKRKKK